jgi:hypothetical protein
MARKEYGDQNGKNPKTPARARGVADMMAAKAATDQPDWGRVDAELLWKVIQACANGDGAVMFGYSRDGGAYNVKVYDGGEPVKWYGHTDQELTEFLYGILEVYDGS